VIGAVAVTAEVALKTQNCEQDADIAECLRHAVVDALTTQTERVSRLCDCDAKEPQPMSANRRQTASGFGQALRAARVACGISQEQLAEAGDFDRTYPSLL
jgi:ribosome-binding protein aMBF1 (putative translation factor)